MKQIANVAALPGIVGVSAVCVEGGGGGGRRQCVESLLAKLSIHQPHTLFGNFCILDVEVSYCVARRSSSLPNVSRGGMTCVTKC